MSKRPSFIPSRLREFVRESLEEQDVFLHSLEELAPEQPAELPTEVTQEGPTNAQEASIPADSLNGACHHAGVPAECSNALWIEIGAFVV